MEFLRVHGYIVCHVNTPQSEEQRYSFVEDHLKAMVAKSLVDQGFYQACHDLLTTGEIPAASLPEEVRNTIMENHNQLHDTAWPKLFYILEAEKTCRYFDPRDVLSMRIYDHPRQLARQVQVMMGDHLETFRVIQYTFMRCGRWFLGYSPGTFIFRYSDSLPFTEEPNIMPSVLNFSYEGQVPRSSLEHKIRLMALWKPASELFIGLMHHYLGRSHKAELPRHGALRSRAVICSDAFKVILEDWKWLSQRSTFPYQNTKDWTCKHATIQELAWLILRLKAVPGVYESAQSPDLENLLTTSTGISLQDLAGLWDNQLEFMAWEHFHTGNRRELFIYENQGPSSNIWRLYNEQTFQNDSCNPSVEYNLPLLRDCRHALVPYDHLIQEKLRQAREEASQST
ncbi:ring finger [Fusarium pseudocircinatum]|uniref:Ring finger n=1 Tax=Fusarium pseudocircinatum TaxID=56676 RepID=A0A8H5P0N9_9HYPO|nr:ring finger [Fusarium pseudocircinatum]